MARNQILRKASLAGSLVTTGLLLAACSPSENAAMRMGYPEGITPQANRLRELWTWSVIAALCVGALAWILIFWSVIFHRKKKGSDEYPRQTAYNVPLELIYTVIPIIIICVLFFFTFTAQSYVLAKTDKPDVVVDVTGFQWNWKFGYRTIENYEGAKYDGTAALEKQIADQVDPAKKNHEGEELPGAFAGKSVEDLSYLKFNKVETVGSSNEVPILVLPSKKSVEFRITSADVAHSFWVPEFLFKRDAFPYPEANHSDNTFQVTSIDKEGAFVGRCAEMCGTFHAMMNFEVRVVSWEDFVKYVQYREVGKDTAQALQLIGQSPTSTSTQPFVTDRQNDAVITSSTTK